MNRTFSPARIALAALAAAASCFGVYTYTITDSMTSNGGTWTTYGGPSFTANGLTSYSNASAIANGISSNDYEVRTTVC